MNTSIDRMQSANERARKILVEAIQEAEGIRKPGREFLPEAAIKWFFAWTLCASGFVLAMTILATMARGLKLLVP